MDYNFELLLNIRNAFIKELDTLTLQQLNYIPNTHSTSTVL